MAANHSLLAGDVVVITSTNGHTVTITILAAAPFFQIALVGAGGDPQVDGKQTGARRRYVVSNAGFIKTVNYLLNGVAANSVQLYNDPNKTDVYTMVHFGTTAPVATHAEEIRHEKHKK